MSYGWATVFTLAAWFAGLVIDANVRVGDLGLRTDEGDATKCQQTALRQEEY